MVPRESSSGAGRVRKASYYVWFLGAWECRGLRGAGVVHPALAHLLARERETEPDKVTLQVSGRGVKVVRAGAGGARHIIPAAAVTYVQQEPRPDDDLVSAVLLLYNPLTRCPVHLHTYRCDSTHTAALLRGHLVQLASLPAQQAKLAALEARLASRGLLPGPTTSDGASTGSSASSGGGGGGRSPPSGGVAILYDSLAAELREKLGTRGAPLLLPPRDYDTMARRPRRPEHTPPRKPQEDDSARSSGIGSDDAPSPTHDLDPPDPGPPSSSDEEWAAHGNGDGRGGEEGLILVQPPTWRHDPQHPHPHPSAPRRAPVRGRTRHPRPQSPTRAPRDPSPIRPVRRPHPRCESPGSPRERFQDARDKFRSLERDWQPPQRGTEPALARTPSWEAAPSRPTATREPRSPNDEALWPKSDRDTGYGSKDGLLRERGRRDYDRGYGTCDTRDSDPWRREGGGRTPDPWPREPRVASPVRPVRDHRMPRVRSPERPDYQRAKSMHDLSQRRMPTEEERRSSHDPRRRSMYDAAEAPRPLRESRSARRYRSQASLRRRSSSCSSSSTHSGGSYTQLPDTRRFPGLDRATARPDPLDGPRHGSSHALAASKRTYDYPVNGGTPAVHINRAQHDDYRRFRYDHAVTTTTPQFVRAAAPTRHY